jgi:hypothetical protein
METHNGHGFGFDFKVNLDDDVRGLENVEDVEEVKSKLLSKFEMDQNENMWLPPIGDPKKNATTTSTTMNSFEEFYNSVIHNKHHLNQRENCHHTNDDNFDLRRIMDGQNYYRNSQMHTNTNRLTAASSSSSTTAYYKKKILTESQRIEIELKMRTTTATAQDINFSSPSLKETNMTATAANPVSATTIATKSTALYKYKPSHIIFNEMCMILQSRAFDISSSSNYNTYNEHYNQTTVHEINVNDYISTNENHLLVYDIAFGLPGSNTSSNVANENNRARALWFRIEESDVKETLSHQRMNVKKTNKELERLRKNQEEKDMNENEVKDNNEDVYSCHYRVPKSFDVSEEVYQNGFIEEPIIMTLPMDQDSFDLTTEVLKHRLSILKESHVQTNVAHHAHDDALGHIQQKFESLKSHLAKTCFWPVNDGREKVDETTLVPKVDGIYSVPKSNTKFGFYNKLWESFVDCVSTRIRSGYVCL